jgi:hypothetical protein
MSVRVPTASAPLPYATGSVTAGRGAYQRKIFPLRDAFEQASTHRSPTAAALMSSLVLFTVARILLVATNLRLLRYIQNTTHLWQVRNCWRMALHRLLTTLQLTQVQHLNTSRASSLDLLALHRAETQHEKFGYANTNYGHALSTAPISKKPALVTRQPSGTTNTLVYKKILAVV